MGRDSEGRVSPDGGIISPGPGAVSSAGGDLTDGAAPTLSSAVPSVPTPPGSGESTPASRRRMRRQNQPQPVELDETTRSATGVDEETSRFLSDSLNAAPCFLTPQYQKKPFNGSLALAAAAAASANSPLIQAMQMHAQLSPTLPPSSAPCGAWADPALAQLAAAAAGSSAMQLGSGDVKNASEAMDGHEGREGRRTSTASGAGDASRGSRKPPTVGSPDGVDNFLMALAAAAAQSPIQEPCAASGYQPPMPSPLSPACPSVPGMMTNELFGSLQAEPPLPAALASVQQSQQQMQEFLIQQSLQQGMQQMALNQFVQQQKMSQPHDLLGGWTPQQHSSPPGHGAESIVPPQPQSSEERLLVNQVEGCLLNKHSNKFAGSVPIVVVQRLVQEALPSEYKFVVERHYARSFHAFLRAHQHLRVFHYDADIIQERKLEHCSPHEGRLAFADVSQLELIERDLRTALWKQQRWQEVLDEVEAVIRKEPMQMRMLLQHFRERPNAEEYAGTLPSNHALRQLLKREPHRFVIAHDATVKVPEQLTPQEREEWEAKKADILAKRSAAAQSQSPATKLPTTAEPHYPSQPPLSPPRTEPPPRNGKGGKGYPHQSGAPRKGKGKGKGGKQGGYGGGMQQQMYPHFDRYFPGQGQDVRLANAMFPSGVAQHSLA